LEGVISSRGFPSLQREWQTPLPCSDFTERSFRGQLNAVRDFSTSVGMTEVTS
jgi:hypothetical protein